MSVTLKIDNFTSVNVKEKTTLDSNSTAGNQALTVVNNQNVAANDFLLLGVDGSETGEIVTVSSVTGNTVINTSVTKLNHARFDPVKVLRGDKLRIYSAPNVDGTQPADSAFITTVATVDIDPDQLSTIYTDAAGDNTKWYKYVFFNSVTSQVTDIAASGSKRGGTTNAYTSLDAIRQEAGFQNNRNISDSLVDECRQAAQKHIDGKLSGRYTVPFTSPINEWISYIAKLLGAGFLQINQYGQTYNTNSDGENKKVAEAEKYLDDIIAGQTVITDQTGTSTATTSSTGANSYPNANTATVTYGSEDYMFKRADVAGFNERKY